MPAVPYSESVPPDLDKFYVSPRVEELLGYTPDEWRAEKWV